MIAEDFQRFSQFSKSCGNRYLAVRIIARWARQFGLKFSEYRISESKLIQSVLTGKCFYSDYEMMKRKASNDDDHIDDFLSWVLDDEIIDEVKYYYRLSIHNRKLIPCTNAEYSYGKITRINVLLRMLWYSVED